VGERQTSPRLLYVTLSLARGGTEQHLAEITPRLAERGWPVSLYCLMGRGEMADAIAGRGVDVIGPPVEPDGASLRLPAPLRLVLASAKLLWVMIWLRPSVVHFYLPGAYLVGGPLSLLSRCPVRIMSRRHQNRHLSGRPVVGWLERWLHKRMTVVLGNSRRVVDELVREEDCEPARVGLIYNGVDLKRFSAPPDRAAVRKSLGIDDARLVLIMVANLIPYKGHRDLMRALGRVNNSLPQPWVALLAGRDDGCGREIEREARRQGIAGRVRLLGSRTDVPALLGAADIGLLTSHQEGFSNAIIEAMAAGLPMVVTDVGGNAEAVLDGVTGHVVAARHAAALGEAILSLANDPECAARMGAAARRRASELFSIEACVAAYEEVYTGLLRGEIAATLAPVGRPLARLGVSKLPN